MQRHLWTFVAILIVAFVLRLGHLYQAAQLPFFYSPISDAKSYDVWSRSIAAGDWLGSEVFYQAPLYPYFLAVTRLIVGDDLWRIRVVQAVLGSLACGLIHLAGRRFFSQSVGVLSGLMAAAYPAAIFFDGIIQKTVLDTFLMSLMIWLIAILMQSHSGWIALAAGIVLGCFALTRENVLLFVPIIALWLVVIAPGAPRKAARWALPLLFFTGLAVTLVPVGLRNKHIGGSFLITTSQFGPNFYMGNSPQATGVVVPLRPGRADPQFERIDATDIAEAAAGRKLTPAEVSSYWTSRAMDYIRTQPLDWLSLMGRKCMLLINQYEVPDSEDMYFYMERCSLLRGLHYLWHFGVLAPLAVLGISLTWPRFRQLWILHALLLAIAIGVLLFYVYSRYRFPMIPILILFAAAGIFEVARLLKERRFAGVIPAALVAAVLAIPINTAAVPKSSDAASYANAGAALFQQGRFSEAATAFEQALQINPDLLSAQISLANTLWQLGRIDEAIAAFQRARDIQPDDADVRVALGSILVKANRLNEAERELRAGLAAANRRPQVYTSLGILLARQQKWGEAIEVLRRGAKEAPGELSIQANLAWNLATCPVEQHRSGTEALHFAQICAEQSNHAEAGALDILAAAYAELGRFEDAISTQKRAIALAREAGGYPLADYEARLRSYESGRPWRRQ